MSGSIKKTVGLLRKSGPQYDLWGTGKKGNGKRETEKKGNGKKGNTPGPGKKGNGKREIFHS